MRKIREVLRLKYELALSEREIARSCRLARSTVGEYLRRFQVVGCSWPLPAEVDEATLEAQLFPPPPQVPRADRPVPDWAGIHHDLRRPGVTLFLLWQEYKASHPTGYQYSQFCNRYHQWVGQVDVVLRQAHRPGEKLFVDYAGQTVAVVERDTGVVRQAEIFVAVLGASNYTYVEATWTQGLADWVMAHVRAFQFFGGCPAIVIPDNLKSGVTKPCRYEPDLNPTYAEMAAYYGVAVIPTRVRRPRDKAKVEVGVQVVERWLLARLRNMTFFSLAELNHTLRQWLTDLNSRPFKKLTGCRRSLFEELDQPALQPLPATPYTFAEWRKARVNIDCHVEVDGGYYSVPYRLLRQPVEVRLAATTVEVFYQSQRVASHPRCHRKGQFVTVKEHLPPPHQAYLDWTPERLIRWAAQTGPATARLVETILTSRPHVQQGFRACLGILRLGKSYGTARLEAAAHRALALGATTYKSVESILKHGLDQQPLPAAAATPAASSSSPPHANLRGPDYYH
jgi:transposase